MYSFLNSNVNILMTALPGNPHPLSLSMTGMRRCPSCLLFYTNSARPSKSGPSTNPRKPRISFFVLKILLLSAKSARSCMKGLNLSFVSLEYLKFSIQWHKHRIFSADVELSRACCWVGWEVHKSSTKGLYTLKYVITIQELEPKWFIYSRNMTLKTYFRI
jgi:hypothetical protein